MRRVFLALLTLVAIASPCWAQTVIGPTAQVCSGFDTINYGDTTFKQILTPCNVTTGPAGIIYATATAEVECGVSNTEAVQMYVGTGTSPANGSNFLGSASGGTLTVSSIVFGFGATILSGTYNSGTGAVSLTLDNSTGAVNGSLIHVSGITGTGSVASLNGTWTATAGTSGQTINFTAGTGLTLTITGGTALLASSPWQIQVGQILSPGSGATSFTPTAITAASGTGHGGMGTYTIADSSLTLGAGTNLFTLNATPGGVTNITPVYHQTACNAGFTIVAVTGSFVGTPNTQYWVGASISTNTAAQQATWNNNGITVLAY